MISQQNIQIQRTLKGVTHGQIIGGGQVHRTHIALNTHEKMNNLIRTIELINEESVVFGIESWTYYKPMSLFCRVLRLLFLSIILILNPLNLPTLGDSLTNTSCKAEVFSLNSIVPMVHSPPATISIR